RCLWPDCRFVPLLPSPGCRSDSAEGFAKQAFDANIAEFGVGAQLGEHGLDLGLAKAEVAQSGEDLGVCVDALRHERVAVGSAVRMAEAERAIALAVDE